VRPERVSRRESWRVRVGAAIGLLLPVALVFSVAAGCKREEPFQRGPPEWQPPVAGPIDETAPGELAEGKEEAFGLVLPKRLKVNRRFDDAVFASGNPTADQVATYFRGRVTAKNVQTGPSKTLFEQARLAPSVPRPNAGSERVLRIEVIANGASGETDVIVRDVTPLKDVTGLTEEERWRRHGLTKEGKVIDPTRLE